MKLARFNAAGRDQIGFVDNEMIVPFDKSVVGCAPSMIDLILRWDEMSPRLGGFDASTGLPLKSVSLLAPILRPGKILAIGLNYADHIAESGLDTPAQQLWFCKQPTSAAAPFGEIEMPRVSDKLDHEVELVAIVGKGGRNIEARAAHEHVFGYCVGNDVSVRDWQLETSQWMLGKSFDTHAPFGPWITTADEIGDPHRLEVRCFVNGEIKQRSNTAHLVFNLWDQIEHLSKVMTLEPGDLIFTGTPGGVGWAETPKRLLKSGDVVRCEIDELGEIENRVGVPR